MCHFRHHLSSRSAAAFSVQVSVLDFSQYSIDAHPISSALALNVSRLYGAESRQALTQFLEVETRVSADPSKDTKTPKDDGFRALNGRIKLNGRYDDKPLVWRSCSCGICTVSGWHRRCDSPHPFAVLGYVLFERACLQDVPNVMSMLGL